MGLVIQDSSVFFGSSLPTLQADAVLNAGSLMLFDVLDPVCNRHLPKGNNFPEGAFLNNLVIGGGDVAIVGTTLLDAINGVYFRGLGSSGVNFGNGWNLAATKWVKLVWYKIESDFSGAVPQPLWHRSNGAFTPGNFQSGIIMEGAGSQPSAWIANATSTATLALGAATTGTVLQVGMAYDPLTGILQGIRNGEIIGSVSLAGGGNLAMPAGASETSGYGFGAGFKGFIYHYYAEDLGISGQAVADVAHLDYLCNVGRFS